ncbi:tripartite tricarboxylate transporter TctB family protein (plasmid) [Bosea vestrisii]|uniref:tripartite tricarboxylate transporter TctB family protein n=1 Tax=Bosea vestrisii TaxID=151416 RepID=UPI0024DF5812|nr:tripartite tricarboxylate transporter TctB family protein [Bosea vestrisii]WID99742.1 tripartite tricarboxylate transporter TctB family protein [Bosea vestrisii]
MTTRLTAALLSLIAATAALVSVGYGLWRHGAPGAGFLPFTAAALLLTTSIGVAATPAKGTDGDTLEAGRLLRYGAVIALYPLLILIIGTFAATAAVFLLILRGIEQRSWIAASVCSLAATAGSWILFGYLLDVPLPNGLLD